MPRMGAPIFFLALALVTSLAQPAFAAEQPYRIDYHGRLATDVYVNGQGPFQFVIDTASSRSLIFERARQKLNLTQARPGRMRIYGINDLADVMPVQPRELRVAGEIIPDRGIACLVGAGGAPDDGVSLVGR